MVCLQVGMKKEVEHKDITHCKKQKRQEIS
jgi:hypothetical protein